MSTDTQELMRVALLLRASIDDLQDRRMALENCDALIAMLAAAPPAQSGWRTDMEKAKTGAVVDVWQDGTRWPNLFWYAARGSWASHGWRRSKGGDAHRVTTVHVDLSPTHWMPLPASPLLPEGKV